MFRRLLSFENAKKILKDNFSAKPIGIEELDVSESFNRVLAIDIVSQINIPPFRRSTVDGYAVKASDTYGASEENPVNLEYCGQIEIGEFSNIFVKKGNVAEIVTGAPLPKGTNSVVMVEYTTRKGNDVFVYRPVSINQNVMTEGSDIRKNEIVLKRGRIIGSREIGVLSALGLAKCSVYKQPRVAIISTGNEIVHPGNPLPPGKIYDINANALGAAVSVSGGKPINLGIIPDNKEELTKSLKIALEIADVIITSGGVSVGPKDFTPKVIDKLGQPGVIISGVAVKPGKPITISIINQKIIFSLPGNPTSALFMYNVFVHPILEKLAGRPQLSLPKKKAIAGKKMFSARGRHTFIMVNIRSGKNGVLIANPVPTGQSGAITTLSKADGFIEISEKQQFIESGTEIEVSVF